MTIGWKIFFGVMVFCGIALSAFTQFDRITATQSTETLSVADKIYNSGNRANPRLVLEDTVGQRRVVEVRGHTYYNVDVGQTYKFDVDYGGKSDRLLSVTLHSPN